MKLPLLSGQETIKKLTHAGFTATRQRGSHVRLERTGKDGVTKLTVPLHKELKRGTLRRILRDADMTLEEFMRL